MNLKTFLSVLIVYRSNFKVLHWMAEGKLFFTIHEKAEDYANMILKDVDTIGEMSLRSGGEIVNYAEALKTIEDDEDYEFLLISSKDLYDVEKFKINASKMFNDILYCINELLDSDIKNVGVKSTLESMYDKYDLQVNYLLKRFND